MQNSQQEIKKGDLVYVKSNKGQEQFDILIGQTFEVVSDKFISVVRNRDGTQFMTLVVQITNDFVLNEYGSDSEIVSSLDELVKISSPPEKFQEQKELENA